MSETYDLFIGNGQESDGRVQAATHKIYARDKNKMVERRAISWHKPLQGTLLLGGAATDTGLR